MTSQQFEDAFEELFRRSPMPQLVKVNLFYSHRLCLHVYLVCAQMETKK